MNYKQRQKELINNINKKVSSGNFSATVVDVRDNYENDNDICLTSVVFSNKEISSKIITKIINPLKKIEPEHYYYPADSLHITIKNIRTIHNPPLFNNDDINKVKNSFKQIIPKFNSFSFNLKGIVQFPTSVSLIGYSDEILYNLVSTLDKELNKIGVSDNKKYESNTVYFGNLTLCRFVHPPSDAFLNKIEELKDVLIGELLVDNISLITCNSVCSKISKNILETFKLT